MRIIDAVVSMLSTSLVAVAALRRVDPAITSGPTAGAIVRSTKVWSSVAGAQGTKKIFEPARRAQRRPRAGRRAEDAVLLAGGGAFVCPGPFLVVVFDPFLGMQEGVLAA